MESSLQLDLSKLSSDGKHKAKKIIDYWQKLHGTCEPGTAEILLQKRSKTIFRITPTKDPSDEHLSIKNVVNKEVRDKLKVDYQGDLQTKNLNIPMKSLTDESIEKICWMCFSDSIDGLFKSEDKGEYPMNDNSETKTMSAQNLILYGPPGTGKTYNLINEALKSCNEKIPPVRKEAVAKFNELCNVGQIAFITFHQSYSYEEFVEGIRPVLMDSNNSEYKNGSEGQLQNISYKLEKGIFRNIAEKAEENENKPFVLLIDEINRGNISKILGELITLVELDKRIDPQNPEQGLRVMLPYSKIQFGVPKNLSIIGTMNTADRSIALVDIALRRRFEFKEMMPTDELIDELLSQNVGAMNVGNLLKKINQRIEYLYDRDHVIGHAYLMGITTLNGLRDAFLNKIIPLLQEYFYGDWRKVCMVLGCPLNENDEQNNADLAMIKAEKKDLGYEWEDYVDKPTFRINEKFMNPDYTDLKKFFDAIIEGPGKP